MTFGGVIRLDVLAIDLISKHLNKDVQVGGEFAEQLISELSQKEASGDLSHTEMDLFISLQKRLPARPKRAFKCFIMISTMSTEKHWL